MAASLITRTGHPNAFLKLNPTHPSPRFLGSVTGLPWSTGPGYPIDTTEYCQSVVACLTARTISLALIFGPDRILRGFFRPVANTLMCVPPTSMTRMSSFFMNSSIMRWTWKPHNDTSVPSDETSVLRLRIRAPAEPRNGAPHDRIATQYKRIIVETMVRVA